MECLRVLAASAAGQAGCAGQEFAMELHEPEARGCALPPVPQPSSLMLGPGMEWWVVSVDSAAYAHPDVGQVWMVLPSALLTSRRKIR